MTKVSDDKERSLVVDDRQESVSLCRHLLVSAAQTIVQQRQCSRVVHSINVGKLWRQTIGGKQPGADTRGHSLPEFALKVN